MYQKGQRVVVRTDTHEKMMLVEDLLATEDGQQLKLKDPNTGVIQIVNPVQETVVEHLED